MPGPTPAQIREATVGTRKKIRYENRLIRDFTWWGNQVGQEMVAQRRMDGQISQELKDYLWAMMQEHYKDAIAGFAKFDFVRYSTNLADLGAEDPTRRRTIGLIMGWLGNAINTTGRDMTDKILATTKKNILASIAEARDLLKTSWSGMTTKQGEDEIARLLNTALVILRRHIAARASTIGITETNWIVEATRWSSTETVTTQINLLLQESNAMLNLGLADQAREKLMVARRIQDMSNSRAARDIIAAAEKDVAAQRKRPKPRVVKVFKTWLTRMDRRVRPTHRNALGQRVPEDKPFSVGTSLLMYPGDHSLGADSDELTRCRCWVHYD